jgi:hypothetical protein
MAPVWHLGLENLDFQPIDTLRCNPVSPYKQRDWRGKVGVEPTRDDNRPRLGLKPSRATGPYLPSCVDYSRFGFTYPAGFFSLL